MKKKIWLSTPAHFVSISFGLLLSLLGGCVPLEFDQSSNLMTFGPLLLSHLGEMPTNTNSLRQGDGSGKGDPNSTDEDGATRGLCTREARPQALTPSSGIGAAMMKTATELYFFIPQAIVRPESQDGEAVGETVENTGEKDQLTFSLTNITTEEVLYEKQLELELPSLLNLDLTKANPPIVFEAGQTYQWQLTLNCDLTETVSDYPSVSGLMRKIAIEQSIVTEIEAMSLAERPLFYAQRGLQYDAIAALIELIQTEPEHPEIETIWQELLPEISIDLVKPALNP